MAMQFHTLKLYGCVESGRVWIEAKNFNSSFILIKESNRILKQFQIGIEVHSIESCSKTMWNNGKRVSTAYALKHTHAHNRTLKYGWMIDVRGVFFVPLSLSLATKSNALNFVSAKGAPQFIPRQRYKVAFVCYMFNLIGSMRFDCSRHKSKSCNCTWFQFRRDKVKSRALNPSLKCEKEPFAEKPNIETAKLSASKWLNYQHIENGRKFKRDFLEKAQVCPCVRMLSMFIFGEMKIWYYVSVCVVENLRQMMSSACNI